MINIKSQREIEIMREAGRIVALTQAELKKHIKPGITTKKLDKIAEKFIKKQGATPSFKGYNGFPASICTSVNDVVVHGIPSSNVVLKEKDIISLDIGVYYRGYHGDGAWTYPVGEISKEDQRLLDDTLQSLHEGLKQVYPNNHLSNISYAIENYLKQRGYGVVEELTCHGIGRELHEEPYVPNFGKPNKGPILKPGMTLCIEPMVNLGTKEVEVLADNWTVVTMDKKRSAHFEHMIAITDDGYIILTKL